MTLEEAKKRPDYKFRFCHNEGFGPRRFLKECRGGNELYEELAHRNDRFVTYMLEVGTVDIELNAWFAEDFEPENNRRMMLEKYVCAKFTPEDWESVDGIEMGPDFDWSDSKPVEMIERVLFESLDAFMQKNEWSYDEINIRY